MRILTGPGGPPSDQSDLSGDVSDARLRELYAAPPLGPGRAWLRVNMVATVDGAATGESGKSGSINNAVDKRVFDLLRDLADVIVVGAGTARVEGYRPADRPTVLVSRSGQVPERLRDGEPGRVLMATCRHAPGLAAARSQLGDDHVLALGGHRVDLGALKTELAARGHRQLLCEGGPHLLRDLIDQEVADELDTTVVPRVVGGPHRRITDGPPVDVPLELGLLLEEEGTLLGRWLVRRHD
jgi:riboflavin biosynthesis pyrimidine reductase